MLLSACIGNGLSTSTSTAEQQTDESVVQPPSLTNVNNANNSNDANRLTTPPQPAAGFLTIVNKQLSLQGKPVTLIGYQAALPDVTNYCGWTSAQLADAMADMQSNSSANAVRVWFLQSAGGPGNWTAFDAFIAQAKAHNLKIIATLVNQWGDCEPNNDAGQKNYKTIDWYQNGYKQTHDGYTMAFRDYARAVAQRYAGESAIGIWQLVNEAEARDPVSNSCPSETASAQAIRAFADDMVDVIQSVDPNHLINLGTQDNGYCGVNGSDFQYIHAGKIDLCEVHSYEPANQALPTQISALMDQCKAIGKPTFLGEVGICRNVQQDGSCSGDADSNSLQRRADFFDAKFKASIDYGMAGVLIWQASPNGYDTTFGIFDNDPVGAVERKY